MFEGRRSLGDHVHFPGCLAARVLVRGVAAPQTLDQGGGGHLPPVHVLLPLLLLHLESEPRAEDSSWKSEK